MDLKSLRIKYHDLDQQLLENSINVKNPMLTLQNWLQEALNCEKVAEANAINISTVDMSKTPPRPSNRVVLCKEIFTSEEKFYGLTFFTNKNSKKGNDLKLNPYISACFFWPELHKSIRIEGQVEELDETENDKYFYSRPIKSQAASACSVQSTVIESKEKLIQNYENLLEKMENGNENEKNSKNRPDHWGGYLIKPESIEFWQGNSYRLHDRLKVTKNESENKWELVRLQP